MTFEFISTLSESKIFRSKEYLDKFSDDKNSELLYLSLLSLIILCKEKYFYEDIRTYLQKTNVYGDYDSFRNGATDLYMLAYLQKENKYFDDKDLRFFLNSIVHKDVITPYRYCVELERQLRVKNKFCSNSKQNVSNREDYPKERRSVLLRNLIREIQYITPVSEILDMLTKLKEKVYV